jgi:hypothetical protein
MSNYVMPVAYYIPRGQIYDPPTHHEGYPTPIAPDMASKLPRHFGSRVGTSTGSAGYTVQREPKPGFSYDDSLAFGGVSGYNFLRRDCKPGAK